MAGKIRNLLNRDGRYYARLVIPQRLRPYLDGKTELRAPLGPDRRTAIAHHPAAVADMQRRLGMAEQQWQRASGKANDAARYPMTTPALARRLYDSLSEFDLELRQTDERYAAVADPDPDEARIYRDGFSGRLTNDELDQLVGYRIERFRFRGNTEAAQGTPEWRELAMALCASTYEAMSRQDERNAGDFTGQPSIPLLAHDQPAGDPLPLKEIFDAYFAELKAAGKGTEMERTSKSVLGKLKAFLGHDDAAKITKADMIGFKDECLKTLSAKTVKHGHIALLAAGFQHAVDNERLTINPARGVKVRIAPKPQNRPKGFTDDEALAILKAARAYEPKHYDNPRHREAPETVAAKQWAPWLCAFSGARIGEVCQLRKQDIRQEGEIWLMRITPEAGTVKTRQYRDVPIHDQLIKLGFLDFVKAAPHDQLFFPPNRKRSATALPARSVGNRIGDWLRENNLSPEGVSPNHGWRHRFKTIGRDLGLDPRVVDAIQGHAGRTAGDNYGDVSVKAMKAAVDKIPAFDLDRLRT